MTIGIVPVACLAAKLAGEPEARMSSTFRATSSAARSGSRSLRPSEEAVLDDDVLALDVAVLAQPLEKALDQKRPSRRPENLSVVLSQPVGRASRSQTEG